jgi:hypothetical protein
VSINSVPSNIWRIVSRIKAERMVKSPIMWSKQRLRDDEVRDLLEMYFQKYTKELRGEFLSWSNWTPENTILLQSLVSAFSAY